MDPNKIKDVIEFMKISGKLKTVYRSVDISTLERKESSVEHSWHLESFFMLLEKDLP